MRSPQEFAFRLRQEAANLAHLALRRGRVPQQSCPLAKLPAGAEVAGALRGSAYAKKVERLARLILRHRFPILGYTVTTGPEIEWRRDYVHGKTNPARYFRRIRYLEFGAAGDHKVIWELNRHQHWVLLAQAHLLTGEAAFLEEIWRQFRSWSEANPYLRSINWASALEVAFRALSWIWVYHLAGERMPERLHPEFLLQLYRHGLYLESNLSVYFSPNTHLLGEAVALHALGALFPAFPRAARWRRMGERIVGEQPGFQVRPDGSHFEQSAPYHVYALDLLLFHACLAGLSPPLREAISRMAAFAADLAGPGRRLPLLGDEDGGRVFHPYGPRDRFVRATLATCAALSGEDTGTAAEDLAVQAAWWLGPQVLRGAPASTERKFASRLYDGAGLAVMTARGVHVVVDAGPFGAGNAGHSHSDTLSVVVADRGEDILIDPGTYTYVSDRRWRDWFRGSAAHNTACVDGKDQAAAAGSFRWRGKPQVKLEHWVAGNDFDYLDAVCRYAGIAHRRQVVFLKASQRLVVVDTVGTAPESEHRIEQFWHTGEPAWQAGPGRFRIGSRAWLVLTGPGEAELTRGGEHGWRSRVFGHKTAAPVVRVSARARGVVRLAAMLAFASEPGPLELRESGGGVEVRFASGAIRLPASGLPECTGTG